MRLASVEVIPYALPFKEPYVTARGTLTQREMVLLRLTTDEGIVGLGEAVPLSLRGGATIESVVRELEEFGESDALRRLAEAEVGPEAPPVEDQAFTAMGGSLSAPASCAVLTALVDLDERTPAVPQSGRLGVAFIERPRHPVRCNATLVAGEPDQVAGDALRWQAEGFSTFKLKLGAGDDVAQVEAVRKALGTEARLRIDVNAAWDLETAKRTLNQLEPFGIQLAEQPVASIEEAVELAGATSIPLAGDESIVSAADATRAREVGAFQLTGVKLSKVGGFLPAVLIVNELPAYVSSALDGPIGIAAAARLAALLEHGPPWPVSGQRAHGLATQRLFASTIASVECELREGILHPPAGPGLGVEIDEDALAAHRL